MSKKRAKSGGSAGLTRWESGILATPFEDETWKASIAWVVPNRLENLPYIDVLSSAIAVGSRKLFNVISRTSLFEEAKELGNPKSKKPKDVPQFFEICELVKKHLDDGEEVPLPLLAKLIKWKLLDVRAKDFKRKEDEKKAADAKAKGKGKDKEKRPRSKSPTKGKGKKSPEPAAAKKDSKLKKRGEEDEENKYIDDEPDDGSQFYVVIHGFHQAPLLPMLAELGINIYSIIKMESDDYTKFQKPETSEALEPPAEDVEEKKRLEKDKLELEKFWTQHEPLLVRAPSGSKLHDVARLSYTVKSAIVPEDMTNNEKRTEFGVALFEDTACLMYDLLDWKRQYLNYLESLKLVHIPQVGGLQLPATGAPKPVSDGATSLASTMVGGGQAPPVAPGVGTLGETIPAQSSQPLDVDMRYYTELMSQVPHESASVPIVMHCMLQQVVATEEEQEPPSEVPSPPRNDGLNHSMAQHIKAMVSKLSLTMEEQEILKKELDFMEKELSDDSKKKPHFYNFGDDASFRLRHLAPTQNLDPLQAEISMVNHTNSARLLNFSGPSAAESKERAARLQELVQYCTTGTLSQSEMDRAFKQFVFECLQLRSTQPDGLLVTGSDCLDIPWDDPYHYFVESRKSRADIPSRKSSASSGKLFSMILNGDIPVANGASPPLGSNESGVGTPRSQGDAAPDGQANPPLQEGAAQIDSKPGTGILRTEADGKARRHGSASSVRSSVSSVHFEKDAEGKPLAPEKVSLPHAIDEAERADVLVLDEAAHREVNRVSSARSLLTLSDLAETQQRNMDDWCYAEHFEPHALLQVLEESRFLYPYMDTYYHKRDNSLLVIMHNPIGPELKNYEPWKIQLHSDVGFRNYLEHVNENIKDWVKVEEDKYQNALKEAERLAAATPSKETESRPSSGGKRPRSQSPKKARSKSPKGGKKSASPSFSVENLDPNSGNFKRPNSLKAWKEEQDLIKAEEEKKRLEKEAKKSKSRTPSPKKRDKDAKEGKEKERSTSRAGSEKSDKKEKDKDKDKDKEKIADAKSLESVPEADAPPKPEKIFPFSGYDVGNDLILINGMNSTLFPIDGGQIRTEKIEFVQGSVVVKTSVLKDGHVFVVHIINPKEDVIESMADIDIIAVVDEVLKQPEKGDKEVIREKAEEERSEKEGIASSEKEVTFSIGEMKKKEKKKTISEFGSLTAHLNDGMCLTLSNYGPSGRFGTTGSKDLEIVVPSATTPSPAPPPSSPSGKARGGSGGKKGKKQDKQVAAEEEKLKQQQEEDQRKLEDEERRRAEEQSSKEPEELPFQQLFVSSPDGLTVQYFLESSIGIKSESEADESSLLVRQSYPYKTSGLQDCEAARKNPAMQETSRAINKDGTVVKLMKDGSLQVLFADGSVSHCPGSGPIVPRIAPLEKSRDDSPTRVGSSLSMNEPAKKGSIKPPGKQVSLTDAQPEIPVISKPSGIEKSNEWITTAPSGERVATKADGSRYDVKSYQSFIATDSMTKEVMTTREDRVTTVLRPDNTRIVDHNEGTRITTFYVDSEEGHCEEEADGEEGKNQVDTSSKVKHVKVECAGYATVIFNCEDGNCTTVFGNRTSILSRKDGSYHVQHHEGSAISIDADGTAVYDPRPDSQAQQQQPLAPGIFVMRHNSPSVLEMIDSRGNMFSVKATGETRSLPAVAPEDTYQGAAGEGGEQEGDPGAETGVFPEQEGEQEGEGEGEVSESRMAAGSSSSGQVPRFFVIHKDGSGTELLRHSNVGEYLAAAECDHSTALIKEPLPHYPGVTGITSMKPHMLSTSDKWLTTLDEPDIIPVNLRSRDFSRFPQGHGKAPGPAFATRVGKGLAVGSAPQPRQPPPLLACPKMLEVRQLIKYKPITAELREHMQAGLKAYALNARRRHQELETATLQDPRSEEEKVVASDLLQQARPEDVRKMENVADVYAQVTAPEPLPPPPQPKPKRTAEHWEKDRLDLEREASNKESLHHHRVMPYFESEWGRDFLHSLRQGPDMDQLSKDLAKGKETSGGDPEGAGPAYQVGASLPPTPSTGRTSPAGRVQVVTNETADSSRQSNQSETASPQKNAATSDSNNRSGSSNSPPPQGMLLSASPSGLRPTNPTPVKAASGRDEPNSLRPSNPTPALASNPQTVRPGNPTPNTMEKVAGLPIETPSSYASLPNYPSTIPEQVEEAPISNRTSNESEELPGGSRPAGNSDPSSTQSLHQNVLGEPRKSRVPLPGAILSTKPGSLPNTKFDLLEDPVRRKVHTASVVGGSPSVLQMRGFEVIPGKVDFGTLKEGCTYRFTVHLKNVGIDSCRYKVKQPPPATGLQVIYQPGPVAAGMKAKLELELYAIAINCDPLTCKGALDHHLEVISEREMMYLPISADILTAHEYDRRCREDREPALSSGARLISTRPPAGAGIIRPRREPPGEVSPPQPVEA